MKITSGSTILLFAGGTFLFFAGFIFMVPLSFQADDYWLLYSALKNPNTLLSDWLNSGGGMYRPITIFALYLQAKIFGLTPTYFYFMNLAIHTANSIILFHVLKKLLSNEFKDFSHVSIVTAAVFFFARFQSVTNVFWISSLSDLLSFLFGISALLMLMENSRSVMKELCRGLLLILSVMAKETGILFMFFSLLIIIFRKENYNEKTRAALITVCCVFVYSLLRYAALGDKFFTYDSGLLILSSGFWRNGLPALLLPFDVNDINYIRYGNNPYLWLLILPLIAFIPLLISALRNLYQEGKLRFVFYLALLSIITLLLYSTYFPLPRLTYINSVPLMLILAVVINYLSPKHKKYFIALLFIVTVAENLGEFKFQIKQNNFQNEVKKALAHYDYGDEQLLVLPCPMYVSQKFSFVPMQFADVYWKTGRIDTFNTGFMWPVKYVGNVHTSEMYDYKITVLDSLTLELFIETRLGSFQLNENPFIGEDARINLNNLIDSVAIFDKTGRVKKGQRAVIYFNYDGVLKNNTSVLFVKDKNMKISKLSEILGLRVH